MTDKIVVLGIENYATSVSEAGTVGIYFKLGPSHPQYQPAPVYGSVLSPQEARELARRLLQKADEAEASPLPH